MPAGRLRRLDRLAAVAAGLALALAGAIVPTTAGAASGPPPEVPGAPALPAAAPATAKAATTRAVTADTAQLRTWWHDNHEFNTTSPVAKGMAWASGATRLASSTPCCLHRYLGRNPDYLGESPRS